MADRNDDRFSSPAALRLARELAARSSDRPKAVAPGYVLGTDADGNTILIPTDVQPSGRGGIFDNAAREFENYGPRTSDFTEGTANAYNAGQQYVQQGRENMQYNPAFGAIQRAGGTLMSAMSPLAGVASSISKPIGRYFGPAPERAADVATTVAPFFGGAGRGSKVRPMEGRALELTEKPITDPIGPREFIGPPQRISAEIQGPQRPFQTTVRLKDRPGDPGFIGPMEEIGPNLPRPGDSHFIGPLEMQGPRLQKPGDFIGPPEMQGPRLQKPGDFIGPPEMQGPRRLPRPTDDEFIGPREFIGPQRPFMAEPMSEPTAVGTMGAGALTLARSMSSAGQPVGSGRGPMIEEPDARANYQFAQDAVGSGRGSMLPNEDDRVAYEKAQALDAAKQRMAAIQSTGNTAGLPPARPREGGLAGLFSGPAYQSKGGELRQNGKINWGDSDSAADFFRADRARMETPDAPGMNRGGAANGKLDKNEAIHRALDIISHLVGHRR
jgi:hypothetical protein